MPWLGLAEEWRGWLPPAHAPQRSPVPAGLLGWFHDGSADLRARFRATAPEEQPGHGERFVFQRTDGPGRWVVRFDGDAVLLGAPDGHYDIQISGAASDLALFLWHRPVTGKLDIQGDTSLLSRYFVLVPPL